MKIVKAYTLLEMLVVMSIMIIVSSVGFYSYIVFLETTRYNQDVANLQHDVLIMQRAAMLLDRGPRDSWIYGVGIDFSEVLEGRYRYFKWCSGFEEFGPPATRGEFPNYTDDNTDPHDGTLPAPSLPENYADNCTFDPLDPQPEKGSLAPLIGYNLGVLNMVGDIEVQNNIRFLLFESVSGRAFVYDRNGNRVDDEIVIRFSRRVTNDKELIIYNLTGRTEIREVN